MVFSAFAFDLQFFCTPTYLLTLEDLKGAHKLIDDVTKILLPKPNYLFKYYALFEVQTLNLVPAEIFTKDLSDFFSIHLAKAAKLFLKKIS